MGFFVDDIRFSIFLKNIIQSLRLKLPSKILILGCGGNNENINLRQLINPDALVVGIDIDFRSLSSNRSKKNLVQMNGLQLGFKKKSFDCIVSYHVLEHIPNYHDVLSQIKRVLKPDGMFLLGVPNKKRLLGYINSRESVYKKIKWNISDYKMRIMHRFENRYGAHAGFNKNELCGVLKEQFNQVRDVTKEYYYCCYAKKYWLDMIYKYKLDLLLLPSLYFLCLNE